MVRYSVQFLRQYYEIGSFDVERTLFVGDVSSIETDETEEKIVQMSPGKYIIFLEQEQCGSDTLVNKNLILVQESYLNMNEYIKFEDSSLDDDFNVIPASFDISTNILAVVDIEKFLETFYDRESDVFNYSVETTVEHGNFGVYLQVDDPGVLASTVVGEDGYICAIQIRMNDEEECDSEEDESDEN